MSRDYVALLRWDVREHWNEIVPEGSGRREHPYRYGSSHSYFTGLLETAAGQKKPVLWIVCSPDYEGKARLPPTLIARLEIAGVERGRQPLEGPDPIPVKRSPQDFKWVAFADPEHPDNQYFKVNNAFHELTHVDFVNARGRRRRIPRKSRHARPEDPYAYVPRHLQNICRLAEGEEEALEELARRVREDRSVFVSYSRHDDAAYVGALVRELREQDFAPWFDLQTIPTLEGELGDRFPSTTLAAMLSDGIRQAGLTLAVVGRTYPERAWTREEWRLAVADSKERGGRLARIVLEGPAPRDGVKTFRRASPEVAAREIRTWWEETGR